jgi:hypothetical protein
MLGSFELHITAGGEGEGHGGRSNALRALGEGQESGFFVLFYRIYEPGEIDYTHIYHVMIVPGSDHEVRECKDSEMLQKLIPCFRLSLPEPAPHPSADISCFRPGGRYEHETPEDWGWACPPTILVHHRRDDCRRDKSSSSSSSSSSSLSLPSSSSSSLLLSHPHTAGPESNTTINSVGAPPGFSLTHTPQMPGEAQVARGWLPAAALLRLPAAARHPLLQRYGHPL